MYRIERNIEASYVDFIVYELAHAIPPWTNISTIKGFPQDYKGKTPLIGVENLEMTPESKGIGETVHRKVFNVRIRIFANDDGQRLDLSSWLFDKLEDPIIYYAYTITNGAVTSKVASGKIVITKWLDNKKEFINPDVLVKEDRYRHILSFECYVAD